MICSRNLVLGALVFWIGVFCQCEEINSQSCTQNEDDKENNIRVLGDPILSTPCRQLSLEEIKSDKVKTAIEVGHRELASFRARSGFGRAIAAPQFGYSIQLICLFLDNKRITMINPAITYRSPDTFQMWDDCLSFPHLMAAVERHSSISVSFVDEEGRTQEWTALPQDVSELLQHEIDHLEGVLAVDKAVDPIYGECAGRECSGIVARSEWLANKALYDTYLQRDGIGLRA